MELNFFIDAIQEKLNYIEQANRELKKARYNTEKQNKRYERDEFHSWYSIIDICRILEVDVSKTMTIVRQIKKWEKRCKWQKCFNLKTHKEKIINYIKKRERINDRHLKG